MMEPTPPQPDRDLHRVGGVRWVEQTGGRLTPAERRRLLVPILRGQAQGLVGRIALLAGRRPARTEIPEPPDSALARAAEDAAAEQSEALLGHAYRTWAFGRALAALDAEGLDEELFYVASLLHDVGLVEAVAGEDFTLRSADRASEVAAAHCAPGRVELLRDAITAHATPGATIEADGAEAFYVQAGATCDLGGLRLQHLSSDFVDHVLLDSPRRGLTSAITDCIEAEADAVPEGRFALLRRTGFGLAIRLAPLPG